MVGNQASSVSSHHEIGQLPFWLPSDSTSLLIAAYHLQPSIMMPSTSGSRLHASPELDLLHLPLSDGDRMMSCCLPPLPSSSPTKHPGHQAHGSKSARSAAAVVASYCLLQGWTLHTLPCHGQDAMKATCIVMRWEGGRRWLLLQDRPWLDVRDTTWDNHTCSNYTGCALRLLDRLIAGITCLLVPNAPLGLEAQAFLQQCLRNDIYCFVTMPCKLQISLHHRWRNGHLPCSSALNYIC